MPDHFGHGTSESDGTAGGQAGFEMEPTGFEPATETLSGATGIVPDASHYREKVIHLFLRWGNVGYGLVLQLVKSSPKLSLLPA